MSGIRTNMLDLTWDPKAIDEKYQVYAIISHSPKYWIGMNSAVDRVFGAQHVLSVCYFGDYGEQDADRTRMHILLYRSDDNDDLLRDLVDSLGSDYTFEPVDDITGFIERNQRVMLQLLINALQPAIGSSYSLNNLSGKYYCIDTNWVRKNGFRALEFIVEKAQGLNELVFAMHLRNFNRIKSLKLSAEEFKSVMDSRQYIIEDLIPKRVFTSDKDNFVLRQHKGKKDSLTFIDTDRLEVYKRTKISYFYDLVRLFNAKYSPSSGLLLCRIGFKPLQETDSRKFTSKTLDEFESWIHSRIDGQSFNIVDMVSDDDSAVLVDDLKRSLQSFGARVSTSSIPIFDVFNICIIHNADYYEDNDLPDPHDRYMELGIQHIVVDDYDHDKPSDLEMLIMVIAKELVIKNDLIGSDRRITVHDWRMHGFDEDLTFVLVTETGKKDSKRIFTYRMTVRPDGTFDINGKETTSDLSDELTRLWRANNHSSDGRIEGMIIDSKGDINVIRYSNITTIPEASIEDELKVRKIRNQYGKENIFKGQLDLRLLRHGDNLLYYSGFPSYSVWKMKTVPNVRVVDLIRGQLFFDSLIDLMNVPFVKYKMMTVKPYPFKYLEEYRKILGLESSKGDSSSLQSDDSNRWMCSDICLESYRSSFPVDLFLNIFLLGYIPRRLYAKNGWSAFR